MEWISVEDRLPNLIDRTEETRWSDDIIFTNGDAVFMGWYEDMGFCVETNDPFPNKLVVTHWMPLPKPPHTAGDDAGKDL